MTYKCDDKHVYNDDGWIIGKVTMYDNAVPPHRSGSGKVIALVVGHDQYKKGAYGNLGISEWDYNFKFIKDLKDNNMLPPQHEYHTFVRNPNISGYGNKMIDLHSRIDSRGCDISIEFHFNGAADSSVNGNEVLYCSTNGKKIADKLDEALDSLPNRDRGVKKVKMNPYPIPDDNGAGFCCRGKSLAIITEPFFGAHQDMYAENGKYRETLLLSYKNFFNSL